MKKEIFIDLLSRFLDGKLSAAEVCDAWPDYDGLPDKRILKNAFFQLSWYETDDDIRAKEPEYGVAQINRIRKCLERIRNSKSVY